MRIPCLLLPLLLWTAALPAADGSAVTSSSTFKLARSARAAALAGAWNAQAEGADAMNWNPAGLTTLRDVQLSVNHLSHLMDINDESVNLGAPVYGLGAWGLGVNYLYASDTRRDNWGNDQGGFNIWDLSVQAAWAMEFRPLSVGLTYKLLRQAYGEAYSMGSGFDAGLQARHLLDNRLSLGLAALNFGTPTSLGREVFQMPMTWKAGAGWALDKDWTLEVDFSHQPVEFYNKWHFGTEYTVRFETARVTVRGGYQMGPESVLGASSGLACGAGFGWGAWQFDYALNAYGDLGLAHRAGLAYSFGMD
jgi:long-subunit fatty acid transport protein